VLLLLPGCPLEGDVLLVAPFGPAFVDGIAGEVLAPGVPIAPELSRPVVPVDPVVPVAPPAVPADAAPVPDVPERDCEPASPGDPMLPGPAALMCEFDGCELLPERGWAINSASDDRDEGPRRPWARDERFDRFFAVFAAPA
jgi:hypothetical protein